MTTGTVAQEVESYLRQVRARLDDLPADEVADLLADVEPSIVASAGESDAPVELRLGPPRRFADELRAAAGLPPRADVVADARGPRLTERLAAARAFLTTSPSTRWLRELAPLWWALRGFVAVGLLVRGADPLLALSVAIAVAAGRDAVLNDGVVVEVPIAQPGLVHDGAPVRNVYPFDPRGRLLHDVRLFDQDGRALAIGADRDDPNRRTPRTSSGEEAFNAFPIRHLEPGTRRVADPAAGAPARPAPLVTAPLGGR